MNLILTFRMFHKNYWIDRWEHFFEALKEDAGFDEIVYSNEFPSLSDKIKTLFLFLHPTAYIAVKDYARGLEEYRKPLKVISYLGDLCAAERDFKPFYSILDRSDVIFSETDEAFRKLLPGYVNKLVFSPNFFAPHERYANLPFNENPIMKCLLSGSLYAESYPLRYFLSNNTGSIIDILEWPKQKLQDKPHYALNEAYAKKINEYFCAVATSGIRQTGDKYIVAKYFEIPAAGTLLLANEAEDLKKTGLRPYEHFVPITRNNAIFQISDCLANPDKYQEIRRRGMEFVRSHHSIKNRVELVKNEQIG